jgi:hypothetical protein
MQRTINRNRKTIGAVLGLLAIAGVAVVAFKALLAARPSAQPFDPADAAVQFTRAFYAVDYRDEQGWLKTLQPLATADGYALLRSNIAGLMWPGLTEAQIITVPDQVHVEDKGLVIEGKSKAGGGSQWQIRTLAVTLDGRLWPAMKSGSFSTNILLSDEQGAWKFSTFLSDSEVQTLKQQASTSPEFATAQNK